MKISTNFSTFLSKFRNFFKVFFHVHLKNRNPDFPRNKTNDKTMISGKATQPSTDKMGHFHITLIFMIRKIAIKTAQENAIKAHWIQLKFCSILREN
jgi:hypothetical protein